MKQKKLVSMMGVLVILIGITLVTVGCGQANKAGDTNNAVVGNGITGVWKVSKQGQQEYPQDPSNGKVPGMQIQMYYCFTADGKGIMAVEKKGMPSQNGLFRFKEQASYKLLEGNKIEMTIGGQSATSSYTLSGNVLTMTEMQLVATKVSSPTEAQIKAAPELQQ